MATVSPEELLRLWTHEKISPDMAIGHIIQNLVLLHSTNVLFQATVTSLRERVQATTEAGAERTPLPTARKKGRSR